MHFIYYFLPVCHIWSPISRRTSGSSDIPSTVWILQSNAGKNVKKINCKQEKSVNKKKTKWKWLTFTNRHTWSHDRIFVLPKIEFLDLTSQPNDSNFYVRPKEREKKFVKSCYFQFYILDDLPILHPWLWHHGWSHRDQKLAVLQWQWYQLRIVLWKMI